MTTKVNSANTSTWTIDASHSEVHFKVKHLVISTVTGTIGKFEGSLEMANDDITTAKAFFSADVESISTGDAQRDGHIQSGDFFDLANHPKMSFESTSFEKTNEEGQYKMHGNLDFHGVNHPTTLDVEFAGTNKDPYGNTKAVYSISGKISRKEWGLVWNVGLETGGWLVSDEVRIQSEIQLMKQA